MGRNRGSTDFVELVETHNIAKSLKRIGGCGRCFDHRTKRALYHALALAGEDADTLKCVREALGLP